MKHLLRTLIAISAVTLGSCGSGPKPISQEELVRRTQELLDAAAPGNQAPWKEYWADDGMFFDEKGRSLDKIALIKDLAPLPLGYSGTIKVVNPQSRMIGTTAILSYDLEESLTIYGQKLGARFHSTDTWIYRHGKWQIVAGQTFRYYQDPAPGKIDPRVLDGYVGVYELAPGVTMAISREGDQLYSQREGRPKEALFPEVLDLFFRKSVEGRRLFRHAADGAVDAMIDRRNNEDLIWRKVR